MPITPPEAAARPPAVVLVHGFAADRVAMSTLARRLAQNGYAVLAIDLHGHGANRNAFAFGVAEDNVLRQDIRAAVNYLRNAQLVDASRIVVMGHSMGAGAALDYATQDTDIAGAVMISGGWALWGEQRPRNALVYSGGKRSGVYPRRFDQNRGPAGGCQTAAMEQALWQFR